MGLVGIVIYTASLLVGQPHPILKVIKQKLVNISWGKAVLSKDLIKFSHKISTSKAVCVTSHVSTDWPECWPHIHTDCRGTSGCLCYASPVCESWVSPCLWICIHMYCRDIWFHSAICSQRLQKYLTPSCTDFIWCRRLGKSFVLYSQRLQEFIVSIPGRGWEDSEWTEWHEDNEGHAGQSKGGGAHTECGGPETEGTAGAPVG